MARIKHIVNWFRYSSQASRDAMVIVCASFLLMFVAVKLGVFEELSHYTRQHEHLHLEEFLLVLLTVFVMAGVYSWRRLRELKVENRHRRAAEELAVKLTLHDALTGLPNRHNFERLVTDTIIAHGGQAFAVLALRVDNFRQTIDRFGHAVGDNLLLAITGRVSETCGPETELARVGPSEFAIRSRPIEGDEAMLDLAERLVATLGEPFSVLGCEFSITVTVGVSRYPGDGTSAEQLLRRAALTRRHLSSEGNARFGLFDPRMEFALSRLNSLESRLNGAIEADAIVPHFQPIVDLGSGRTVAFECLARWYDPQLGWVGPDQFIPIAEECGYISKLGDRLLRKACSEAMQWPSGIGLSYNISAVQLRDRALGLNVLSAIGDVGLSPWRLELEITETALVNDIQVARDTLEILANTGVSLALDDFGTGHSSLRYLCDFPIHKLKIDQSFVRTMCERRESEQVVNAVIGLARGLGIASTAEGIENKAQWRFLRQLGCQYGQGYLFGKAMPASDVREYLARERKKKKHSVRRMSA
ncbi:bifunctional diguanylate cyclase/phosphodiesterase [Breoghania sp.]|uniref:putative bifunctional diguanylate cyclase/phosphodiesterase n=1 Tax=Breoghania sp. TaxID=2065378 RepID=UPI002AA8CB7B|nr:bifunctional diguanylate cyclase/phosphodiesterase [Breoghania sp.]